MPEPRKIVLILGNGFDLDLGLKTSYKDYWESEFCPKDYPAPLIKHLNQRWGNNLDGVKWYDLENELLSYAIGGDKSDVVSEEERKYICENSDYNLCNKYRFLGTDDTFDSLQAKGYLRVVNQPLGTASIPYRNDYVESSYYRDLRAFQLIKERLCVYLKSIDNISSNIKSIALSVLIAAEYSRESGDFLNIYSFNYTTLPMDFEDDYKDVFHYVHGSCSDEKIIVGTRDDITIDKSYDFLQKSFDPHFNPPALVADLLEADEVIIFGHSIGENDRQYFKAFFKQQTDYSHPKPKDITIFTKDNVSEVQIKRSLQQMTDGNLSTLYGLNHIQILKTTNLAEDQHKMFDFFINHHFERQLAEEIIGKLLH